MKSLPPGSLVVLLSTLAGAPLSPAAESPSPVPVRAEPKLTGMQIYEKGKKAFEKGDLAVARQCFEQLLKAKPDLEIVRIQLAQVAVAEREAAKIPRSLKVARANTIGKIGWTGATLEDAISTAAKQLEKAGASENLAVNVTGHLPESVRKRLITMSVSGNTFDHVFEALSYTGQVRIAYISGGLALSESAEGRGVWDAGDPKAPNMEAAAKKVIIKQLSMSEATVADALDYLQNKAAELSGGSVRPILVTRHDFTERGTVTLDLRNVSLHDALRSVCLVADVEEKWFPWGAGIDNRRAAAAPTGPPRKNEAP